MWFAPCNCHSFLIFLFLPAGNTSLQLASRKHAQFIRVICWQSQSSSGASPKKLGLWAGQEGLGVQAVWKTSGAQSWKQSSQWNAGGWATIYSASSKVRHDILHKHNICCYKGYFVQLSSTILFTCSERAQLFYTLEEDGLLVWIQEMGLNRYTQGIIRHAPSGADLVKLVTSHHEHVSVSTVSVCLSMYSLYYIIAVYLYW